LFGVGWGNPTSVQASGEPVQEKLSESVKLMVESGHADTVTVSLTVAWLQALVVVEIVCVGEVSVGEPALEVLVLPKSLAYFPVPLFRVMEVVTLQPAEMQLIGSSGRQSPPFCERTWARSPLPTKARSHPVSSCTVAAAMV